VVQSLVLSPPQPAPVAPRTKKVSDRSDGSGETQRELFSEVRHGPRWLLAMLPGLAVEK